MVVRDFFTYCGIRKDGLSIKRQQTRGLRRYLRLIVWLVTAVGCVSVGVFMLFHDDEYRITKITYLNDTSTLPGKYATCVPRAKDYVESLVNEYRSKLRKEINPTFKDKFALWNNPKLGVKFIISTFDEYLIYVFPDAENELIVEVIGVPVQTAFLLNLIDLSNPKSGVKTNKIKLSQPFEEVAQSYAKTPTRIILAEGAHTSIAGGGNIVLNNVEKFLYFSKDSSMTIDGGFVEINNNFPLAVQIHGHPQSVRFNLAGPLTLTGGKEFYLSQKVGKTIAQQLVDATIRSLIVESDFFKKSLAHSRLESMAKEIMTKKTRAENDPQFAYPFWQFKMDVKKLEDAARTEGIETDYVRELLEYKPLMPVHGTLLWYYSSAWNFVLQWTILNVALLLGILCVPNWPNFHWLRTATIPVILAVNAWVFVKKPEPIGVIYWLLPGALFIFNVLFSILRKRP
jgi:hypothetical protein